MYFEDLSPYAYTQERLPGDAVSLVNFGWLDRGHDYRRGQSDLAMIERVLRLAALYANAMRGFHRCPFCQVEPPVKMTLGEDEVSLGFAEIRVTAGDTTYVAPSLLPHYMAAHEYLPPDEVIQALEKAYP